MQQNIPGAEYRTQKRNSVFNKVDINSLDFSQIPFYQKTPEQTEKIESMLKNNFLTKNLSAQEITKLAGAMKLIKFETGKHIIRYGDVGKEYFIYCLGKNGEPLRN